MRYLIALILVLTFGVSIGQIYNPVPQYVYKNKLGVGRSATLDSSAYLMIGPNNNAVAGLILPRVSDTLSIVGTKRHGLMIFSSQLDKPVWYDSTNAVWTEMGTGGVSATDAVVLFNGSVTVGDSLLVSNAGGDTAWIKNILLGSGLIAENMGDTVLKINIDSSLVPNIYNSDGTISTERTVSIDSSGGALYFLDLDSQDWYLTMNPTGSNFASFIELGPAKKGTQYLKPYINMYSYPDSINIFTINSVSTIDGSNKGATVTIDSSGVIFGGTNRVSITTYDGSANVIMSHTESYVILQDLTTGAASRTFRMIPRGASGQKISIINESTDGTYKWTFTGTTVIDKDGSTVTAITDDSVYELLFDGTNWRIINKY